MKKIFSKKAQSFQDILYRANLNAQSLCYLAELTHDWEVPRDQVEFGHELGEGAFGKVYFAKVLGFGRSSVGTDVAVKVIKKDSSLAEKVCLTVDCFFHTDHA